MKNSKSKVVARMTITKRGSSKKTIIEVHSDASFKKFYTWYSQDGRQKKRFIMTSHRGDGITPYWRQAFEKPGLDVLGDSLQDRMKDIESVQIKVFKKREYKWLLTCAPDQLSEGLGMGTRTQEILEERKQNRIPVRLPAGYLPLQRRMDILTGGRR